VAGTAASARSAIGRLGSARSSTWRTAVSYSSACCDLSLTSVPFTRFGRHLPQDREMLRGGSSCGDRLRAVIFETPKSMFENLLRVALGGNPGCRPSTTPAMVLRLPFRAEPRGRAVDSAMSLSRSTVLRKGRRHRRTFAP